MPEAEKYFLTDFHLLITLLCARQPQPGNYYLCDGVKFTAYRAGIKQQLLGSLSAYTIFKSEFFYSLHHYVLPALATPGLQ